MAWHVSLIKMCIHRMYLNLVCANRMCANMVRVLISCVFIRCVEMMITAWLPASHTASVAAPDRTRPLRTRFRP